MLQETRSAKRCLVPWLKVFGKVHKVTPCSMCMIAHDIVQHSSDCDTNEFDEASRSARSFLGLGYSSERDLRVGNCSADLDGNCTKGAVYILSRLQHEPE